MTPIENCRHNRFLILKHICKPTLKLSSSPALVRKPAYRSVFRPWVQSTKMQSTPRPLPGAPPTHLTSGQSPEIRSYRPLPTPPVQAAGTHHSFENIYLRTHPALAASSAGPSNLLSRPRPKLHISVKSPIPKRKNSLDSLTVRTPAFRDPGQALVPAVDRWRNPVNVDRSRSRHTPHNSVLSRVSSAKSFGSRPVVKGRASTVGPYVRESEEDGSKSSLAHTCSVPSLTC